eukprot:3556398-Prymnesium_polylepis.1
MRPNGAGFAAGGAHGVPAPSVDFVTEERAVACISEQEPPYPLVKQSPRATTVYTKLSTTITAIRMKLSSNPRDGLLTILALMELFNRRAAIHSVMAAGLDELHRVIRLYLTRVARVIHDHSRKYLVANAPIPW